MIRLIALTACTLLLGACNPGVGYTQLEPSQTSAERALAAEAALEYPHRKGAMRQGSPPILALCGSEGREFVLHSARLTEDGICGRPSGQLEGQPPGHMGLNPERCWTYEEMSSIGLPRDIDQIAIYPMRDRLDCGAAQ